MNGSMIVLGIMFLIIIAFIIWVIVYSNKKSKEGWR